ARTAAGAGAGGLQELRCAQGRLDEGDADAERLNRRNRMLAMQYRGPYRVRATHKGEPEIEHPNDAIIRVTRACICGSDLHLYHGLVPDTRVGHTFGHEFTGIVEEVGP